MAGFVHHRPHNAGRINNNSNMYMEGEAPGSYGYGFHYYNPGRQNFDGLTNSHQNGVFNNDLGVGGNGYYQPPVQHQMHYNKPYSVKRSNGSGAWVQVGSNPYCIHGDRVTQTIQGDVVQRGNFNGRGMGARLHGHFNVSGDIN